MGRPKVSKYRRSRAVPKIRKCIRDEIRGMRDDGLTYRQIAKEMKKKRDRISYSTVRRIILSKGHRKPLKSYSPRSIPRKLHPTIKLMVDKLYAEESTRTTNEIINLVKEGTGIEVKRDVIANMRAELGLRHHRVRYGHSVRLINQLIRMIYCERKLEMGEQFLTHTITDESYIQLGKNARTCFVKNRKDAVHAAPKHVPKVLVWGGISVRGPCPLKVLRGKDSIVDSIGYQRILQESYLKWSRETFGPSAILIQDWAPAHSSKSTRLYLERSGIQVEDWPPESADLSPIETVWGLLKRWLSNHWKPKNMDHLVEGIHHWWDNYLTQDLCVSLIERMQFKMREILSNRGRPCPD